MILGEEERIVTVHSEHKIKRKRKSGGVGGIMSIVTEPEDKIYRVSFFKRQRQNDKTSVPFGYKCKVSGSVENRAGQAVVHALGPTGLPRR